MIYFKHDFVHFIVGDYFKTVTAEMRKLFFSAITTVGKSGNSPNTVWIYASIIIDK